MWLFYLWYWVLPAVVGAFATAYLHEQTGRDPRTGGVIGALVGFFGGWLWLVSVWVFLYYNRNNAHIINRRRRWWEWWRP